MPNILGVMLDSLRFDKYIMHMVTLNSAGAEIAARRKKLGLSQTELARRASVSRATVDALENGRTGELGFSKIVRLLSALGLSLSVQEAGLQRPTLDELMKEDRSDQSLERRR
jgi:HTH-type transcriptional regulator / antitoxin HipB